jgi:predicted RNA-binding protein
MISEISDDQLAAFSRAAHAKGTLRTLVESVSALDPLLADFLYVVDHKVDIWTLPITPIPQNGSKLIRLSSWQSYGRPEVLRFEAEVDQIHKTKSVAVALPCSRKRPYRTSRIHKKIWRALSESGYEPAAVDQLVVTSLGVVPEALWDHPAVLAYDAGVPDIYRVLRLARRFFSRNSYTLVVDCLQFVPYSDILRILQREKILRRLSRGPVTRSRQFYLKP